jgi:hypothetical protein
MASGSVPTATYIKSWPDAIVGDADLVRPCEKPAKNAQKLGVSALRRTFTPHHAEARQFDNMLQSVTRSLELSVNVRKTTATREGLREHARKWLQRFRRVLGYPYSRPDRLPTSMPLLRLASPALLSRTPSRPLRACSPAWVITRCIRCSTRKHRLAHSVAQRPSSVTLIVLLHGGVAGRLQQGTRTSACS